MNNLMLCSLFSRLSGELVLLVGLPCLLGINFFLVNQDDAGDFLVQKKKFFILLRFAQGCLLVAFFLSWVTNWKTLDSMSLADLFIFHAGNFFFRVDSFILTINSLITILGLFFLYLVGFVFSRTTPVVKYISEIPFLIVSTIFCLRLFIAANDFILIIMLLEIITSCTIVLLGLHSTSSVLNSLPIEAAVKYFVINALAVVFLLFAISGYLFVTGSLNLIDISLFFQKFPFLFTFFAEHLLFLQSLFFIAYFIKLGAAPVHNWVPDVYEGAETLMTSFLVILISPTLMFKLLMFFKTLGATFINSFGLTMVVSIMGMLSIFIGTFNAFYQTRIKRFIAYTSITHLGFMFLGLADHTVFGYFSFLFYLIIYVFTTLAFFIFFLICQNQHGTTLVIYINQLKPYIQRSLFLLSILVILVLSFAGIPPFAGFFSKFFVLLAFMQHSIPSIFVILLAIIISTYMYLRFIKIALFEKPLPATKRFSTYEQLTIIATIFAHTVEKQLTSLSEKSIVIITSDQQKTTLWEFALLHGLVWIIGFIVFFIVYLPFYSLSLFDLILVFELTH